MSFWDRFKTNKPTPVMMFGLKVGLYKNESIKKTELAIIVHPDNFEKAKQEVLELYAKYLAKKP